MALQISNESLVRHVYISSAEPWPKHLDILRMYAIDDFQSEPHQKNQNFFERWWQVIKRLWYGHPRYVLDILSVWEASLLPLEKPIWCLLWTSAPTISSLPQEIALQNKILPYKRYYSLRANLTGTNPILCRLLEKSGTEVGYRNGIQATLSRYTSSSISMVITTQLTSSVNIGHTPKSWTCCNHWCFGKATPHRLPLP